MTAPTTRRASAHTARCDTDVPLSRSHAYRLLDTHRHHHPPCPAYNIATAHVTEAGDE